MTIEQIKQEITELEKLDNELWEKFEAERKRRSEAEKQWYSNRGRLDRLRAALEVLQPTNQLELAP